MYTFTSRWLRTLKKVQKGAAMMTKQMKCMR